ncbi:MAG: hypothetical protein KGI67_14355 [Pseudomonadota bacterium]|nr:hypothetical protein [Pseudomonadota bacterium]
MAERNLRQLAPGAAVNAPLQQPLAWPTAGAGGAGAPTGWLASVRNAAEAGIALAAGASIIDAKEPRLGALGALPAAVITAVVAAVAGRVPVSATVGDLPFDAAVLAPAMLAVAAAGADIVKIGVFGAPLPGLADACLAALPVTLPRPDGRPAARVAVLMADQGGIDWPLAAFAAHGFSGVMLDTADKARGGLRRQCGDERLALFLAQARALGLRTGLAGSLCAGDVPALAALGADYLGFRTALCHQDRRVGTIDAARCRAIHALLAAAHGAAQVDQAARPSKRTAAGERRA